jgi:HD-like signal output (HDOD) protein
VHGDTNMKQQSETNGTQFVLQPGERIDLAELTERIGNLFASPSYQPPVLPSVAVDLLDVARYPTIDLRRIAAMIERDPLLAGRVMRQVNSPFYQGQTVITTLPQAIFRLGLIAIRDIVLETALSMRLFTNGGYATTMERVRRHSVATGHVGRIIARHTGQDEHEAYLLGLLHDIGIAATLITIDEMFADKAPPIGLIWPTVETIHESAGILLARIWDLPGDLPRNIGQHHDFRVNEDANPMVAIMHLAEHIATRCGRGILPGSTANTDHTPRELTDRACQTLGIGTQTIAMLSRLAEERLDTIR